VRKLTIIENDFHCLFRVEMKKILIIIIPDLLRRWADV